jgi:hypothetical protein
VSRTPGSVTHVPAPSHPHSARDVQTTRCAVDPAEVTQRYLHTWAVTSSVEPGVISGRLSPGVRQLKRHSQTAVERHARAIPMARPSIGPLMSNEPARGGRGTYRTRCSRVFGGVRYPSASVPHQATEAAVTIYHGGDQLDQAQKALERHAMSSANGRCVSCGIPGPCRDYESAARVFKLSLRLPRRVPGLTRPELVNARRVATNGSLAKAT